VFLDQLRATIEIVHGAAPTERFSVDSARLGSLVDLYRSQQRERGWRPAATFVSVPALTRRGVNMPLPISSPASVRSDCRPSHALWALPLRGQSGRAATRPD
jgi:hypothetical protein